MTAPSLPLNGKSILVPRGKDQAQPFSDLIRSYGGKAVEIPLIAFKPVEVTDELRTIMSRLYTYDWIIFTSNVTVETFVAIFNGLKKKELPKVASIGKRTENCLLSKGIQVDFTPQEYVAEGFVEEFLPLIEPGSKVLIPKGNLARDYICSALTAKGALVDEVVIYSTYFPIESKQLLVENLIAKKLDILTFTSPSTVDHLMDVVKEYNLYNEVADCLIGCIGPITTERAKHYKLTVHSSPDVYTVHHMLQSIIVYLEDFVK
ncbi:uroporphyrinogen-III synthase [Bacillus sp. Bva_UNVM-123]|uniref:uroporphyrinogen-III synthase n=1 Tax=Bacillus sp. Bva_UNVM-123 TaxID=2829798 RepID=UPI00391F0267